MIHIVRIDEIQVGERRREDLGDLTGLAESIQKYALLHPIVIDGEGRLVAGQRRLTACRDVLGWEHIECKNLGDLSEDERREIELEENLRRKDLTPFERAKEMVRQAKAIAPILAGKSPTKTPRGEPRQMEAPKEEIAQALGTSRREIDRAEQHTETAEEFPVFQQPSWKQYHVLEAREVLGKLPEGDRAAAVGVISEPATPPQDALKMLRNLEQMPAETRADVFEKFKSEDTREHSLAVTRSAAVAAEPDPRLIRLGRALDEVRRCARMFKDDPANAALSKLVEELRSAMELIERLHGERVQA